jgi:hypothetical protein
MPITQPFQTDPASVSSEEEPQRGSQIVSRTQREQELMQKKQQQEQEDADFKKQLDDKNLKELMQVEREQQVEAAKKAAALDAVKRGDLGALSPYMKSGHGVADIDPEDNARGAAIIAEKGLRNESFVGYIHVERGEVPAQALEESKKWLRETFPTIQTDAIIVRDTRGNYAVETLGVSIEKVDAAEQLQIDKRRAEERSAEVTARIQEKIKEGPQKTAVLPSGETAMALATPGVQHESAGVAPAHRG